MLSPDNLTKHVKAAQAGEEFAWTILHKNFFPAVYGAAIRLSGDIALAKDLTQDAFVSAFLNLSQLKDPLAFGGWLKKIVYRNFYRAQNERSWRRLAQGFPNETEGWWEDSINAHFENVSTQSLIYASLERMPEIFRGVLLLRYFSNYSSYELIASILGVPVGTVRSRLNQARSVLASHWQNTSGDDPRAFKENEEWNGLYYSIFTGAHWFDDYKRRFINHLRKDVMLHFSQGTVRKGSGVMDGMITADRTAGSWFRPVNVYSSGNLSIVEAKHHNSPEHPDHCPDTTVCLIHRTKGRVEKMNIYFANK